MTFLFRLVQPRPSGPAARGPGRVVRLLVALASCGLILGFLTPQGTVLRMYEIGREGGMTARLPRALMEVSGLAMTPDGRLFAHNDERAVFYQLDLETGELVGSFSAGVGGVSGDFEGLAVVGKRFFLVTSSGEILETEEGRNASAMTYRVHDTDLGRQCELEGLAFDPRDQTLLLPCKEVREKELEDHLVVFSLPLTTMRPNPIPRIYLPLEELKAFGLDDEFFPSAIEIHPETGNLLIASAREETILELSPLGTLLDVQELRRKIHPQTEGIAFAPDGSLLLADEGQGRRGRLTRYPPNPDSGGTP